MLQTFGRYELQRKIGHGGMGEVFLAVQRGPSGFEKTVALKLLHSHLAEEPGLVELFLWEARLAADLSHPNVCQIFDLGVEEGRHFIVMEYLSGQALDAVLSLGALRQRPLPPALGAYVVARTADGLAYAHERVGPDGTPLGIVHRDVSPQNIFVTYDGTVKVVDFGIARAASRGGIKTETGLVRGKLRYMSPEQVQAEPLDARSDIFSLGVVLFEAMAGQPLFRGESDFRTMELVLRAPFPSRQDHPDVPAALWSVMEAALVRERDQRLPTARDFGAQLDAALRKLQPDLSAALLAAHMRTVFAEEWTEVSTPTGKRKWSAETDNGPATAAVGAQAVPADAARRANTLALSPERPTRRRRAWAMIALAMSVLAAGVVAWAWRRPVPTGEPARHPTVVAVPVPAPAVPSLPSVVAAPRPATPSTREQPKRSAARRATRDPPARDAPPGYLTLETSPWSEIYDGERKLGATPLVEVKLPPGRYRLRAVNRESKIDRVVEVEIVSGRTTAQRLAW